MPSDCSAEQAVPMDLFRYLSLERYGRIYLLVRLPVLWTFLSGYAMVYQVSSV